MIIQIIAIFKLVLPLYMVVAVGVLLRRVKIFDERVIEGVSLLNFYSAAPALILWKIAQSDIMVSMNGPFMLALMGIFLLLVILIYGIGDFVNLAPAHLGTFTQGAFRSNMFFVAIPVCLLVYGEDSLPFAFIVLTIMLPAYNALSVLVLSLPHHRDKGNNWILLGQIIKNPLILSCVAGILLSLGQIQLPAQIQTFLELLGRISLPMALLELGAKFELRYFKGVIGLAGLNAFTKLILVPAAYFLLMQIAFPVDQNLKTAVIMMAAPTAMMSYLMARQMSGDQTLAGQQVMLSTFLSAFTMPAWILAMGF